MKKNHLSPINNGLAMKRSAAIAIAAATMLTVTVPEAPASITPAEVVKLLASNGAAAERFGYSIAVDGNTALVGAPFESSALLGGGATGLAYVYVRDSQGVWMQQAELLGSDAAANDQFGFAISIKGNTALIGSINNDNVNGVDAGAAYVFVRDWNGVWTQQAKLLAADGVAFDNFGSSVSVSNGLAVIGAMNTTDNGTGSGSAYVFANTGAGVWTQQTKLLPSDGAMSMAFGSSVSVSGDMAIIGAPHNSGSSNATANPNPSTGRDGFSNSRLRSQASPAVSGARTGFGARRLRSYANAATSGGSEGFGASRLRSHGNATQNNQGNDGGDNADGDNGDGDNGDADSDNDGDGNGDADNDGDGNGDNGDADNDGDGDGAPDGDGDGDGNSSDGAAYVYMMDPSGAWTQTTKLAPADGTASDQFGQSVSISGDTAVVGAPFNGDTASATGSAYVFTRDNTGVWSQQGGKLTPADGAALDTFGAAVAVQGNVLVVGAPFNGETASAAGAAYLFTRDANSVWTQQSKILPNDGAAQDQFGNSVAVLGNTAFVAASKDDDNGLNSGSAYVFNVFPADFNQDGVVDGVDMATVLTQWGTAGTADLNGDGTVDGVDLALLLANWGTLP